MSQLVFPGKLKMEFGGTCWHRQAKTVDLETGEKAKSDEGNVKKKLMTERRVDKGLKYGPVFGNYGYTGLRNVGREIRVGDEGGSDEESQKETRIW